MKVLLTSGGTREPIDGVRFISNFSSGTTGAAIADHLRLQGFDVFLLHGAGAQSPELPGKHMEFLSFADLEQKLRDLLSSHDFDFVIHMAAVSDFSVSAVAIDGVKQALSTEGKISSSAESVDLHLSKNKKLLPLLKSWSKNRNIQVIGFKLTNSADEQERLSAVSKLFDQGGIDWVVHNDLSEIGGDSHKATFYGPMGPMSQVQNKKELASQFVSICSTGLVGGFL